MADVERWLSVEEIAKHLGVSKETIYKMVQKRKIPGLKIGNQWRFKKTTIDKWIEESEKLSMEGQNGDS